MPSSTVIIIIISSSSSRRNGSGQHSVSPLLTVFKLASKLHRILEALCL
jgi:hypothetical protein